MYRSAFRATGSPGGILHAASNGDPRTMSDKALAAFARAYNRRVPEDEVPTISADQLDAEIACAFGFLNERGRDPSVPAHSLVRRFPSDSMTDVALSPRCGRFADLDL